MEIHNGEVYKLKITPGILKKYFKQFKTSPKSAGIIELRLVFLAALRDFLANRFKVDDLDYVATQIYYEIKKPNWFDDYDRELAKALSSATELSYINWRGSSKEYNKTINALEEYYKRYKNLLEAWEKI